MTRKKFITACAGIVAASSANAEVMHIQPGEVYAVVLTEEVSRVADQQMGLRLHQLSRDHGVNILFLNHKAKLSKLT